jgi:hypothetical protein
MDGPIILVPLLAIGLGIPFVVAPMVRAIARRIDRDNAKPDAALVERLENMERNIDVIAIEIEKLAEGQRFVTKLLAERERPAGVLPPTRD